MFMFYLWTFYLFIHLFIYYLFIYLLQYLIDKIKFFIIISK